MATWVGWVVFSLVIIGILACIGKFLTHYKSRTQSNEPWGLTLCVCGLALFFSLVSLFIVPVDAYFASHSDYDSSSKRSEMKWVYYSFDILFMCFIFAFLPFAYFMYEELGDYNPNSRNNNNNNSKKSQRACTAAKYTFAFILVFVVLIIIGAFINFNQPNDDNDDSNSDNSDNSDWKNTVTDSFQSHSSRIVPFCLAVLICVGLFFSMIYTSWGLAALPIGIMRSMLIVRTSRKSQTSIEADLKIIKTDIDLLNAKYVGREGTWSKTDQDKKRDLTTRQRNLERKMRKAQPGSMDTDNDNRESSDDSVCCALLWNGSAPIRYVVGMALLAWGALIVVCMGMHLMEEGLNSDCGYSCGFQLEKFKWTIPIQSVLTAASPYFPLDYILFAGIIVWLFIATIAGVVTLDVRVLCFKLFTLKPHRTVQNALILAVGFIVLIIASFSYLIMTLAPNYTSFGNDDDCSVDTCEATAIYYILSGIQIGMPIFGLVYFVFSWIFVGVFILSLLWNACRKPYAPDRQSNNRWGRLVDDELEDEFRG